ncbi:MAG3720 family protein [Mycoplasmopsis agalactiae]|uniref:MAG3720 family protein n=1 Tax=Mycoplasmopsis agalactiae TaxID=2110 RepID=UPI001F372872|nr:hypothetical protein [Mycoplasmopsis agalactiae]MCE6115249.1 hypothetical protein [Mycoplasmopsis agalactiae]
MKVSKKHNYFGAFYLSEKEIEVVVLSFLGTRYIPVYQKSYNYDFIDISKLKSKISEIKSDLNSKLSILSKRSKYSIEYSLILADKYVGYKEKSLQIKNDYITINLAEGRVTDSTINQYHEEINKRSLASDDFIISNKTFLYKVYSENNYSKEYVQMPYEKEGKKLVTNQLLITLSPNSFAVSLLKCLKNAGFDIKKVFLESECLNISKLDNKFKFIVNFSWNFVSFLGVVNNSPFFYKKYVLDITRMNDIFAKEANVSLHNFDLLINSVVKNYDLYTSLNENNLEERILVVLKNIVTEVSKEIKALLDDNIACPDIEIQVNGKNADFVSHILKKEISGYSVIKAENTDMLIFGTKKYFVGAAHLASDNLPKISNTLELLNTIPLYKAKTPGISKILKSFQKSVNA